VLNRPEDILLRTARAIDRTTDLLGRAVSWFMLALVLVGVCIVVLRYGFRIGFAWLQESMIYLHGTAFLIGAAYAFRLDKQVRLDLYYSRMTPRMKTWVNIVGCLLIVIPLCVITVSQSFNYVLNSWFLLEGSMHRRGIPAVFLLKSMLWVFALLLAAQAISIVIRGSLFLARRLESPEPGLPPTVQGSHPTSERC
jgi:TRAP-type mannitol/chloroaromatic compound transport system permease small subunit